MTEGQAKPPLDPAALTLAQGLAAALSTDPASPAQVRGLRRLSGGASQETWAFERVNAAGSRSLILRRAPPGASRRGADGPGLAAEAALTSRAGQVGVPVPEVLQLLQPGDGLGEGFVMQCLPGETLGRRIAAAHRPALARQCGDALARIHALPLAGLPPLRCTQPRAEVEHLRTRHASHGTVRPVFQLALRWLAQHAPADVAPVLVHGDFRNGNLMVDLLDEVAPLRGVLDWELAHLGDAMADLGWLCANPWRFGQSQRRVGGFGLTEELLAGYRAAGGQVDEARVYWWQVLGTLRWGIICEGMGQAWLTGAEPVMEKAAIGRRASETEIDLLTLIAPRWAAGADPVSAAGAA
jgi:aminoglycoside phosphotransferase (APT) family kinase protein